MRRAHTHLSGVAPCFGEHSEEQRREEQQQHGVAECSSWACVWLWLHSREPNSRPRQRLLFLARHVRRGPSTLQGRPQQPSSTFRPSLVHPGATALLVLAVTGVGLVPLAICGRVQARGRAQPSPARRHRARDEQRQSCSALRRRLRCQLCARSCGACCGRGETLTPSAFPEQQLGERPALGHRGDDLHEPTSQAAPPPLVGARPLLGAHARRSRAMNQRRGGAPLLPHHHVALLGALLLLASSMTGALAGRSRGSRAGGGRGGRGGGLVARQGGKHNSAT